MEGCREGAWCDRRIGRDKQAGRDKRVKRTIVQLYHLASKETRRVGQWAAGKT
jgi:hypothetical protein